MGLHSHQQFEKFFDIELLEQICKESGKYAVLQGKPNPNIIFGEIRVFIGIILVSGINYYTRARSIDDGQSCNSFISKITLVMTQVIKCGIYVHLPTISNQVFLRFFTQYRTCPTMKTWHLFTIVSIMERSCKHRGNLAFRWTLPLFLPVREEKTMRCRKMSFCCSHHVHKMWCWSLR